MKKLRYVRKFRVSVPQWFLFWAVFLVFYVFYLNAVSYLLDRLESLYLGISLYWMRFPIDLLEICVWMFLALVPFTYLPRKILLFSDGILIKFWSFRSWKIAYKDVERLERIPLSKIFSRPLWFLTWPIAFGLLKPAIYLKSKGRIGFYFRTRRDEEFLQVFRDLKKDAE
jgi:hypothetical protein